MIYICVLQTPISYKTRNSMVQNYSSWLRASKIKAFYSLVDSSNFQEGATSLLQAAGLGKMRPNILLMGYKQDWTTCSRENLNMYFNIMQ